MRPKKWLQIRLCGDQMLPSSVGEVLNNLSQDEGYFLHGPLYPPMWETLWRIWGEGRWCGSLNAKKEFLLLEGPWQLCHIAGAHLHKKSQPLASCSNDLFPHTFQEPTAVIILKCNTVSWWCSFSHGGHPRETCVTLNCEAWLSYRMEITVQNWWCKEGRQMSLKTERMELNFDGLGFFYFVLFFSCTILI